MLLCACSSVRIERRFPKPIPKSNQLPAKQEVTDSVDSITAKSPAKVLQKFPELARIIEVWPALPAHIRTAILTLAQPSESDK